MPKPPSGTVTFLFTDIEGSTRLAQAHPTVWPMLQARHRANLQNAIESHGGFFFQIIGNHRIQVRSQVMKYYTRLPELVMQRFVENQPVNPDEPGV